MILLPKNLYLALGDSLTAGYGVGAKFAFPSLYYSILLNRTPGLRYTNLGANGLTTAQLDHLLNTNRRVLNLVSQAALISLTIGSNDLLSLGRAVLNRQQANIQATLGAMSQNLISIGQRLRSANPAAKVQVATLYNPLPAGPFHNFSDKVQPILNDANSLLASMALGFNFSLVPIDQAIKGRERIAIGPDFLHPSEAGHLIIAQEFARF